MDSNMLEDENSLIEISDTSFDRRCFQGHSRNYVIRFVSHDLLEITPFKSIKQEEVLNKILSNYRRNWPFFPDEQKTFDIYHNVTDAEAGKIQFQNVFFAQGTV